MNGKIDNNLSMRDPEGFLIYGKIYRFTIQHSRLKWSPLRFVTESVTFAGIAF